MESCKQLALLCASLRAQFTRLAFPERGNPALRRTKRLVWGQLDKRRLAPRTFADDERCMDFGSYIETERSWPGFGQDGNLHTPP